MNERAPALEPPPGPLRARPVPAPASTAPTATTPDRPGPMDGWLPPSPRLLAIYLVVGPLYLVAGVVLMIGQHDGLVARAGVVAAVAVFAVSFFRVRGRGLRYPLDRIDPLGVAGLFAGAIALCALYGPFWTGLFVMIAAGLGLRWAGRQGLVTVLASTVLAGVTTAFHAAVMSGRPWSDALDVAGIMLETFCIGLLAHSFGQTLRANVQLTEARAEVARLAVADERLRVARDVHDLLGHSLSVIALKSELAGRLVPGDPQRAAEEMAEVEQVARRAMREVREVVTGDRQPTLVEELTGAARTLEAAGIAASVTALPDGLPSALDGALAWTVREAVTNVIRHSGARHCTLRAGRDGNQAVAEIVDDGPGPDAEPGPDAGPAAAGASGGGRGLAGLAQRIAALGGTLETGPNAGPEPGYRVAASVPLSHG